MPARALLIATATLLAAPAAASAANQLPVGQAHGVRIVQSGDGAAIVFGRRANGLWRRIAGRPIEVSCTQLGVPDGPGIMTEGSGGIMSRAPKSRRPLPIGTAAGNDYCAVLLRYERGRSLSFETVVAIPLTQAGAVALDEREKAGALIGVLTVASSVGEQGRTAGFPTPVQLTRGILARVLRSARLKVVALAAATDTPPVGVVGYWSDGAQSAACVTLSSAGRRLYFELGPDEELHTNIARSIFNADG